MHNQNDSSSLFSNPFLCLGVCFCLFFYLILLPPTFCKILKHINLSCIGMQQAIIFGCSSTTKEPKSKSLLMFAEKIPGKRIWFFGPTTTDRIITRRRTRKQKLNKTQQKSRRIQQIQGSCVFLAFFVVLVLLSARTKIYSNLFIWHGTKELSLTIQSISDDNAMVRQSTHPHPQLSSSSSPSSSQMMKHFLAALLLFLSWPECVFYIPAGRSPSSSSVQKPTTTTTSNDEEDDVADNGTFLAEDSPGSASDPF